MHEAIKNQCYFLCITRLILQKRTNHNKKLKLLRRIPTFWKIHYLCSRTNFFQRPKKKILLQRHLTIPSVQRNKVLNLCQTISQRMETWTLPTVVRLKKLGLFVSLAKVHHRDPRPQVRRPLLVTAVPIGNGIIFHQRDCKYERGEAISSTTAAGSNIG